MVHEAGAGRAQAREGLAALYGLVSGLAVAATVLGMVRAGGALVVAGMTGGCAVLVSRAGASGRAGGGEPPLRSGALAHTPSCVTAPKLRPPNFPPPK